MRHTLYSGSEIIPLVCTSEGPKEMSQQIGKVLSDCKTAEHWQTLGFNTYPHALQFQISLLNARGFRVMNRQLNFTMYATSAQNFLHCSYMHFKGLLLSINSNIYYSCDQISCCPEVLNVCNGLMLLVFFESKQTLQRFSWVSFLSKDFPPQRSLWRKSEKRLGRVRFGAAFQEATNHLLFKIELDPFMKRTLCLHYLWLD